MSRTPHRPYRGVENDLSLSDTRPQFAMQVGREVNWDETDFTVFGAMLASAQPG